MSQRTIRISVVLMLVASGWMFAACRQNTAVQPKATAAPAVPTALPPAPTAPPLTQAPTEVPTATAVPPTPTTAATETAVPATAVPATATTITSGNGTGSGQPTAAASVGPTRTPPPLVSNPTTIAQNAGPLAGLYVTALRLDPAYPQKLEAIKFYATLVNRSGKEQHYPVCAEIFRPGAPKSFGISDCMNLTIVPGTSEVFAGSWIASGIKECIPVRARAVLREQGEGEVRWVFTTPGGAELWTDFTVCP